MLAEEHVVDGAITSFVILEPREIIQTPCE